uniref:uncharacterized protein LOC101293943 isoform X2 n=1 Tax=Fragaria vesca subsp. vesca TaxID=101020 RepID=UPI0005C923AB|nr:PREDICTED: uncharacterized protein LOC101293943 isoform X2 [Fragaria vesca subsp. vesca]
MKFSMFFFLGLLSLLFQHSHSTTMLVDGISEWKNPTVHVGDSIIFQHKYHYNLYIFQNQGAFNVCNFTQATLLNKPDSTSYTWHPSRPGFFYFSFSNGSLLNTCQDTQKLAIRVSLTTMAPVAAPEPSSKTGSGGRGGSGGGVVSSSPTYPWPFQPHQASLSPSPEPSVGSLLPNKGGGMPFINSNPAVPLPTGEVDSATIRPIPTSGHQGQVLVGLFAAQMALFSVVLLML